MPTEWIDFKELRARVSIADVLAAYNVQLKVKGDRATGFCPLPGHAGKKKSPSFSVHLKRNLFNCFSCHAQGNCIDLVAYLEGLDPKDPANVRKAALILNRRFAPSAANSADEPEPPVASPNTESKSPPPAIPTEIPPLQVVVNAPLDFQLRNLDAKHAYLSSRGLTEPTIATFGLGFCSRGLLADRIAIPIYDRSGRLIGYAGRVVDDQNIGEENPKYRFPGERVHGGVKHEFHKADVLYNAFRVGKSLSDLVIVEGFMSVFWLHQLGYGHVVALMGSSCSRAQAQLATELVERNGRIWLLSDGDDGGQLCGLSALPLLARHRFTRWIELDKGRQPTDCTADELAQLIGRPR